MENLKVLAPLDKAFEPIYRSLCAFKARAEKENGPMIRIALERNDKLVATRDMQRPSERRGHLGRRAARRSGGCAKDRRRH